MRSPERFCTMFTGLPPATGSCSAACNRVYRRTGRDPRSPSERRIDIGMETTGLHVDHCSAASQLGLPRRAHSHGPLRGPREAIA
eukprot:5534579-Prymnesium_polylepis.1